MVERQNIFLKADDKRVLLRNFNVGSEKRILNVLERILKLSEEDVLRKWNGIQNNFSERHRNFEILILDNYKKVEPFIQNDSISEVRKKLIGSYFSHEYSIEAASLFNPSIVAHPDQTGLNDSQIRVIISLRATGEGHISSIEFRSGIINSNGEVKLDKFDRFVGSGNYNPPKSGGEYLYKVQFEKVTPLSEKVLFPLHPMESNGMEDARFVKFVDENKEIYYSTYTAYDGKSISVNLIETYNFNEFKIFKLNGSEAKDKGMALFPRKINGKYKMISRQDGENIYIMESDNLFEWNEKKILSTPKFDWDFIQLGNCGSPLEIDEGWLLITHGVGPLRKYVISALLLDKDNPDKIIGYLPFPLIEPDEDEREGYVPNVVYSCGSIIHNEKLIIPYAMSDSATRFASVSISKLLNNMTKI
ncbi:MAG: glycosidase [Ignavibacteriales bacterium]|nr:MAG: glycosidase [Ignavibacteriales bacterium]